MFLSLCQNFFANAGAKVTLFYPFQSFFKPFFNVFLTNKRNSLIEHLLQDRFFSFFAMEDYGAFALLITCTIYKGVFKETPSISNAHGNLQSMPVIRSEVLLPAIF